MSDQEEQQRLKEIMEHPSYKLAYLDQDFVRREELRPRRLEMELLKPEVMLEDAGIKSTVVAFGGTQVAPREEGERMMAEAKAAIEKDPDSHEAKRKMIRAERVLYKSRYYEECREFARLVTTTTSSFATASSSLKPAAAPASWRQPTEVLLRPAESLWR